MRQRAPFSFCPGLDEPRRGYKESRPDVSDEDLMLLDADPAKRKQNLQTVTDGLALAEAIGAKCCVDIAGSFNPEIWFGRRVDPGGPVGDKRWRKPITIWCAAFARETGRPSTSSIGGSSCPSRS